MVNCLGRGADLHMAQLMPLPLTVSYSSKSRLVLPFWYRFTRVVPDKGPLNVCVWGWVGVCGCVDNARNNICSLYWNIVNTVSFPSAKHSFFLFKHTHTVDWRLLSGLILCNICHCLCCKPAPTATNHVTLTSYWRISISFISSEHCYTIWQFNNIDEQHAVENKSSFHTDVKVLCM